MSPPVIRRWLGYVTPPLFVLLWSTGFIGAKFGLPYAEPFTFLFVRLVLVSTVLSLVARAFRAPWPRRPSEIGHLIVTGILVHGFYLGGVFAAIARGMPAGMAALIVGLQPLLTALLAPHLFGERVVARQWAGLTLGLLGVGLVVSGRLGFGGGIFGILWALAALLGITAGTLYQKRFGAAMDLRTGTAIQYMAAATLFGMLAVSTESLHITWTLDFLLALLWLTFVLSVGAIFLLYLLLRDGQAAKVASLFYLTPPVTACLAWALFGEAMTPMALGGFAVSAIGVALARRA